MNCITMTNPSVTSIKPKFNSNIRQQTPFTFGQKGFGADIASMRAPARRERLLRPVFAELATEYKLRGACAWERCVYRLQVDFVIIKYVCDFWPISSIPVFGRRSVCRTSYVNVATSVTAMLAAECRRSSGWIPRRRPICWSQVFRSRVQCVFASVWRRCVPFIGRGVLRQRSFRWSALTFFSVGPVATIWMRVINGISPSSRNIVTVLQSEKQCEWKSILHSTATTGNSSVKEDKCFALITYFFADRSWTFTILICVWSWSQ